MKISLMWILKVYKCPCDSGKFSKICYNKQRKQLKYNFKQEYKINKLMKL